MIPRVTLGPDRVRDPTASGPAGGRPGLALLGVCVAVFLAILDTSLTGLLTPAIHHDLGGTIAALAWIPNGYVLTYAVLIASAGVLGDRLGRKPVFIAGVFTCGLGSLVCALAPSLAILIAGRVIQGVGAAAMLTIGLALISVAYPTRRAWAFSIYVLAANLGGGLGPILGAVLAQLASWRWAFLAQLPVAAVAIVLTAIAARDARGSARRLDLLGVGLITAAMLLATTGLLKGADWGWATPGTATCLLGAVVLGTAFLAWERHTAEPMLRLSVFQEPTFVAYTMAGVCIWFGVMSLMFYVAVYLQTQLALSILGAGLVTLAFPATGALSASRVSSLVHRHGQERMLVAGLGLLVVVTFPWIFISREWPIWLFVALLGAFGITQGLLTSLGSAGALAAFSPAESGVAAASYNTLRQLAASFGIAATGAFIAAGSGSLRPGSLDIPLGRAFGFRFLVIAALAAVAVWLLNPRAMRRTGS